MDAFNIVLVRELAELEVYSTIPGCLLPITVHRRIGISSAIGVQNTGINSIVSVVVWRRRDMLCSSGIVDDDIFFYRTIWVSRYQKGKTSLDLNEARYYGVLGFWQWHRLDHANNLHLLAVPRFRLNTYGRRAFSVAGPSGLELTPGFYPGSNEQHRLF